MQALLLAHLQLRPRGPACMTHGALGQGGYCLWPIQRKIPSTHCLAGPFRILPVQSASYHSRLCHNSPIFTKVPHLSSVWVTARSDLQARAQEEIRQISAAFPSSLLQCPASSLAPSAHAACCITLNSGPCMRACMSTPRVQPYTPCSRLACLCQWALHASKQGSPCHPYHSHAPLKVGAGLLALLIGCDHSSPQLSPLTALHHLLALLLQCRHRRGLVEVVRVCWLAPAGRAGEQWTPSGVP